MLNENEKIIIVPLEKHGERIDSFIAAEEGITRSAVAKLIENNLITVLGAPVMKNYKVRSGDEICVSYPPVKECEATAEDIALDIVYEDDDIIVINKPSGMVVHPAAGNPSGTLVNGLLHHCGDSLSGIGGVIRPGIVHRIDKDTSGLLVVAKNDSAHLSLSGQLKGHHMSRVYYAIVCGNPKNDDGIIDSPIGRSPTDRKKMAVIKDPLKKSKEAITHYKVLERYKGFAYVKCELETGRTHQIRVHMSSIGHPLLGDDIYGGGKTKFGQSNRSLISGQCLHAGELRLTHPVTQKQMVFNAELPREMQLLLEKLRKIT